MSRHPSGRHRRAEAVAPDPGDRALPDLFVILVLGVGDATGDQEHARAAEGLRRSVSGYATPGYLNPSSRLKSRCSQPGEEPFFDLHWIRVLQYIHRMIQSPLLWVRHTGAP